MAATTKNVYLKNVAGQTLYPYTTNVPHKAQFSFADGQLALNFDKVRDGLGLTSDSLSFSLPYQTFSQVTDNQVTLSGLPVGIKTDLGNYYPVQKNSLQFTQAGITLTVTRYLAYDGLDTFSGTWTAYFACGRDGQQGPQGQPGAAGATGPANTLTIGTVSSGDTASATISGTAPNQILNLVLPKGDKGDPGQAGAQGAAGAQGQAGPANTLSIGTVTSGSTASASITGNAPNQTLNLVLPKGDKGDTGADGATGATGPANTLTIGTVSPGDTAQATITGTSPSQVLNLVLPKGDTGQAGASAYQVWINDGNAGTQTDFLNSLKATGYRHPFTAADISDGTLTITTTGTPVSISDQASITYPLQSASYKVTGTQVTIDMAVNLSAIGKNVSGTWYVNFAAGGSGAQPSGTYIIEQTSASFTPAANNIYKHTIVSGQSISFTSTNMSAGRCSTFELWLTMGASVVSFSLPDTLTWVGATPNFDSANTLYALVIRWDGQSYIANLAYTKSVA